MTYDVIAEHPEKPSQLWRGNAEYGPAERSKAAMAGPAQPNQLPSPFIVVDGILVR